MLCRRFPVALTLLLFIFGLHSDAIAKSYETQTFRRSAAWSVDAPRTTVNVAETQIIGDPATLLVINKLNLSGHNIEVNRWKSALGIDTVMQKLSLQVPQETLAWGDAGVIYLHWTTVRQSHFLMVAPIDDSVVEFTVSSIDAFRYQPPRYDPKNTFRNLDSYRELKSFLCSQSLNAELLLDIKDHTVDSESFTMLFELRQTLSWTDAELKNHLKSHGWHLRDEIEHARVSKALRTIEATRFQQHLRIDLIDEFGKTFVHINQTGSLVHERNQRTN